MGYSRWGGKELDMTEHMHTLGIYERNLENCWPVHTHTHTHTPVLVFILKCDLIITIRGKIPALRVEMSNHFIIFWMVFPFLTIFQK